MQDQNIPRGYCHCGCGQRTKISPNSRTARGWIKGEPRRFLPGHNFRDDGTPLTQRFAEKTVLASDLSPNGMAGCIVWTGTKIHRGYGVLSYKGTHGVAHRWAWMLAGRALPEGIQLDHLCRRRDCVNADHLEPVTPRENVRRGANTKLTPEAVVAIRAARAAGVSARALGAQYGVAEEYIRTIFRRDVWADV